MEGRIGTVVRGLLIILAASMSIGCAEWSEPVSRLMTMTPAPSLLPGTPHVDQRTPVIGGEQSNPSDAAPDADRRQLSDPHTTPAPVIVAESYRSCRASIAIRLF